MDFDSHEQPSLPQSRTGSLISLVSIPTLLQQRLSRVSILRRNQRVQTPRSANQDFTPPPEYKEVVEFSEVAMRFQPRCALKSSGGSKDGAIDWECATHGVRVLALAMDEERNPNPIADIKRQNISRKLYIDAMTYLLRAVPHDLSVEERVSMSSSLPDSLSLKPEPAAMEACSYKTDAGRSILQRCLATWILSIFLVFQLLRPYLKALLNSFLHYERKYRLTERLIAVTLRAGEEAGKIMGIVREMDDGRVGDSLQDLFHWWVRGVSGGLRDGVTEGVAVLSSNERRKRDNTYWR